MKKAHPEARGIYLRGDTYWLQPPMRRGVRHRPITLQTKDFAEAINRAKKMREIVALKASEGLLTEMNCFIAYCTAPQRLVVFEIAKTSAEAFRRTNGPRSINSIGRKRNGLRSCV